MEGSNVEQVALGSEGRQAALAGAAPKAKAEEAAAATTRPAIESFLVIGRGGRSIERTEQQPPTMSYLVYLKEALMAQQPCSD